MTTQEMIFNYLKDEGFVPSYDEDRDIRFKYQMRNFIVSNYENDKQFLQIMMPYIFDVTAENRRAALEACNKINADKKYKFILNATALVDADTLLDITPAVLAKVNELYAADKAAEK